MIPPTGPFQFEPGGAMDDVLVLGSSNTYSTDDIEEVVPEPATPKAPVRAVPKKLSVGNIVDLARARLAELKTELEAMQSLQTEHDELERLLAAANPQPQP